MKAPWLKFYVRDWQSDPALRIVSLGSRGLWIEMLCLMHQADPVGSLVVNGRQVTTERLAAMVGSSLPAVAAALKELEESGVFSREEDGTIYSRRMRRDVVKAAADRANGAGGGNPNLRRNGGPPDKGPDNGGVNPPDKGEDKAQRQRQSQRQIPEAGRPAHAGALAHEAPGMGAAAPPAGRLALSDVDFEAEARHLVAAWPELKGSFRELLRLDVDRERGLSTIRDAVASRSAPVGSWKLMGEIIAERDSMSPRRPSSARIAPLPGDDGTKVETPMFGRIAVARLIADHNAGNWRKGYGPPKGEPGCVVPMHLWGEAI